MVALDCGFAAGVFQVSEALSFYGRADGLKRRKAQGSQTTIQQSVIDINVVRQQLTKDTPKIGQIVAQVKGFKQTDAAENFEPSALASLRAL
jgi:hypothetical protein